jgi:phage terminase large subunit
MPGSVLQTFDRVIKGAPVIKYGGEKVEKYIYSNGSQIWVAGMDNPDKLLSSERDVVYVNQAEELTVDQWEKLLTRSTGRAGNIPNAQVYGDCNPGGSKHWILERSRAGRVTMLHSSHKDNCTLYNDDGTITEQGEKTIEILSNLTGVRRERLFLGKWVTAEGAVYDMFDKEIHVKMRNIDEFQRFYLACDEGYTNPAVILLVGEDGDGRLHIMKEYYQRGKLPEDIVLFAKAWYDEFGCEYAAVDAAAAGLIASMRNNRITAIPAKGRVLDGIRLMQDRLKVQGDGLPRLTVDPGCVETVNEFESYVWKPEKDEPLKESDHAMDAARYLLTKIDGVGYVHAADFSIGSLGL